MSDYGDGMDVDDTRVENDVNFSASAKGKRSAANLSVEAQDSLPWHVLPSPLPIQLARSKRVGADRE